MSAATDRPPVTEAMRQAARQQPGGWVYVIDPGFDPDGAVPPEGVVGAYRVDERGEVTDDWQPNPRHRPTPAARGLPRPENPLEDLLQRVATGWASQAALVEALRDAEVLVVGGRPDGAVFVTEGPDGARSVWAFTSEARARERVADRPLQAVPVRRLARSLPPDADLELNPGSGFGVRIPHSHAAALAEPA